MKFLFYLLLCIGFLMQGHSAEKKIALLFLTVGDLHHPNLWKKALEGNEEKFSIYIHVKNEMEDPYFRPFCIAEKAPTSWSIHMRAWQLLLKEAFLDERNDKFVFLSEACIPLHPLSTIYAELLKTDKSYISYGSAHWLAPNRIISELPEAHRWVNQEWIILNRRHAAYFIEDQFIIEIASRHDMDIEAYPSVYLSLLGELNDDYVINKWTTFVDWQHRNVGDSSPYHFFEADPFSMQLLEEARQGPYFFGRKFMKSFPQEILEPFIIENLERSGFEPLTSTMPSLRSTN